MIVRALSIVLGICGLIGLVLVAYSLLAPDGTLPLTLTKDQLTDLVSRNASLGSTFRPVLDLLLLAGAYLTVCTAQWLQHSISTYFSNRKHF